MMKDEVHIEIKQSLSDESKEVVLVDDSMLLKVINTDPSLDIFKTFGDFIGKPFGLQEYLVSGSKEQNLLFETLYGVPKTNWNEFKNFVEKLLLRHNGKEYGPFFLKANVNDIKKRGNQYPIYELVPIFMLSVINYSDSKILLPITQLQEKPGVGIEFTWKDYEEAKNKRKRHRSHISKQMRFEIYQRDEFCCYYSKRHKDDLPKGVFLTLDHKIPYSDGGDDSFNNLVTACSECNEGKSNKVVKDL